MSQTIRISDEVYEAIEAYRSKNQSMQEVVEEMAEDFGLLPEDIRDVGDLRSKLESLYGFKPEEVEDVLRALHFVYVGQEMPNSIGIPHQNAGDRFPDEINILQHLNQVKESHYTGKYDYGYRTTQTGSTIGSEFVRHRISERERDLEELILSYDEALLAIFLRYGFKQTESNHLSDRGAVLNKNTVPEYLDIRELLQKYRSFKTELEDLGIAVTYNVGHDRTVIPPEFTDFLDGRVDTDDESVLVQLEIYQTITAYAQGELDNRKEVLHNLDFASEDQFENVVEDFHQEGLTSDYLPDQEVPFLIKSSEGVEDRIETRIKELVGISE